MRWANRSAYTHPAFGHAVSTLRSDLGRVMVMMMVMVMMRSRGKRRSGENQDQEHSSKDLLHGEKFSTKAIVETIATDTTNQARKRFVPQCEPRRRGVN